MEYTTEQALKEIVRRRKEVKKRRERKRCIVFASMSCFLAAALMAMISIIPARSDAYSLGTTYGSFLLSPQAGGYVFTAVVAFGAGVSIAVYALRRRYQSESEREMNGVSENGVSKNNAKENNGKDNGAIGNDKKEGET